MGSSMTCSRLRCRTSNALSHRARRLAGLGSVAIHAAIREPARITQVTSFDAGFDELRARRILIQW